MTLTPLKPHEEMHLIVDVQKDFHDEGGAVTSFPRCEGLAEKIVAFVKPKAFNGSYVVFTMDTHVPHRDTVEFYEYQLALARAIDPEKVDAFVATAQQDYNIEAALYGPHCEYGTDGWDLSIPLLIFFDEMVQTIPGYLSLVQKPHYDMRKGVVTGLEFNGWGTEELLAYHVDHGVKRAYVHGLITNVCVKAAVEACLAAGLEVVVYEELVNSVTEELQQQGLNEIEALGATVIRKSTEVA